MLKRLLLSVLMIVIATSAVPVQSATLDAPPAYPTGVADIPWGASKKEVQRAMKNIRGVEAGQETEAKLTFTGGTLADHEVSKWEFLFFKGQFTEAIIHLKPAEPLRQYEALRQLITAKYRKRGREERENAEHRATYWDYASSTRKWGIACDTRPTGVTLVYKEKQDPPKQKPAGI